MITLPIDALAKTKKKKFLNITFAKIKLGLQLKANIYTHIYTVSVRFLLSVINAIT